MIRPPAIQPGGRVTLVAAAGALPEGAVDRALTRVEGLGWVPVLAENARGRRGYLSGSDEQRASDLNAAIRDPSNQAIWFLRGGYGTMRILERIDWDGLIERPRVVVGFSDNTAIHLVLRRRGLVSFHGPHPGVEDLPQYSLTALHRAVTDPTPLGRIPFPQGRARAETLLDGIAEGPLVGGNLSLLAAMVGTAYAPRLDNAILFLEDVAEPAYRIDRLLTQLQLAGVLDGVAGIAVGAISDCPDPPDCGFPSPEEVLFDRLGGLGVPIAVGFPFGHVANNHTLPLGVRARLDASRGTLDLLESGVSER